MSFRIFISLCLYVIKGTAITKGTVVPKQCDTCVAVIQDPLEKCTNLFSEGNFIRSEFEDLKDPSSRFARRMKRCIAKLDSKLNLLNLTLNSKYRRSINEKEMTAKSYQEKIKIKWNKILEMSKERNKEVGVSAEEEPPTDGLLSSEPMATLQSEPSCSPQGTQIVPTTCNELYYASVVDLMPFSYQMLEAIDDMFKRCCGNFGNAILCSSDSFDRMTDVNRTSILKSDIVFPVLGKTNTEMMHKYHFTPIYDAPNIYYFTKKPSKEGMTHNIVNACKNLWPLLTVCLLLAVISGFIAWFIETLFRVNTNDSEYKFHVGVFEWFWWAFVSMSTVGYGDKAPVSFVGKIFAIVWILIGITICSMLTASLTTEITKLKNPEAPNMREKTIGALKSRLLDGIIVAKHGGIIKEVEHNNVSEGFEQMNGLLNNGSISGFVIDSVTFHYFISRSQQNISGKVQIKPTVRDALKHLLRTEFSHEGEKLSFGILFKHSNVSDYFADYFAENQLYLDACYYFQMNAKMREMQEKDFLFDPAGGLFYRLLYYIGATMGLILIYGVGYECRRLGLVRWGKCSRNKRKVIITEEQLELKEAGQE